MPIPDPTGWVSQQQLSGLSAPGGSDFASQVETIRMQQMMSGQEPIPEFTGDPRQYIQLLAATNHQDIAASLAGQIGSDLPTLMQEASASGMYEGGGIGGFAGKVFDGIGKIGETVKENPGLLFAAPLGLAAAGGYFGAGAGATAGSGNATVSSSIASPGVAGGTTTFPYAAGGSITGSAIPGVTSGTTAANAATAGIGPALTGAATFADKWLPTITGGVNALLGARASDQAADAESNALQAAIGEQRRQYDADVARMQPWVDSGTNALNQINNPQQSFQASPGYQWARSEGIRDIGNSFSARGGAQSGNALRALAEWQTGLAQQDYGNWWNQQSQRAGLGQNAVTNVNNIGQNTAANVGNMMAGQGVSRASGVMGKYGSLAQGLNQGVSNWLYRRRLS